MKIVIIGSGNVAWHLTEVLQKAGNTIIQIYSRTLENAKLLADKLHVKNYTETIAAIDREADLYILCTRDNVIESVAQSLKDVSGIVTHTSGSTPMQIFEGKVKRFGVFYPFQTFSKSKEIDFKVIPMCIEGADDAISTQLIHLAQQISDNVACIDSQQRLWLHLTAIYTNNFANHLCHISQDLLEKQSIPKHFLNPLIEETFEKIKIITPFDAQTGPAKRNDGLTIAKHLELLAPFKTYQSIYKNITESIIETYNQ